MTAQTWIDRTRDLLLAGTVEPLNRLDGAITDGATATFSVEFPTGAIAAGTIIEIDTELMYVTSTSGLSVTVMRGYAASTAPDAGHIDNSIIRVNPQYPSHQILDFLNDDLNDLSSPNNGLYQIKTKTFTYSAATQGYDMNADVVGIHRVTFTDTGGDKSEPEVRRWSIRRNRDTDTFASGIALVLTDAPMPGQTVRVEYSAPFTTLASESSTLASTGLHAEAYDLPSLGAALGLMTMKPIPRESVTSQGSVRRAEEVPSGAISASLRDLRFRRQDRITAEATRLSRLYPVQWVRSGR
jgi:hypothetical protein